MRSGFQFWQIPVCLRLDSKTKKSDDYVESKGVLSLRYSTSMHYTIAHLRRVDGALPQHSRGRKALDLRDVCSPARFCCMHCWRLINFYSSLYSDLFMTATAADTFSLRTNRCTVAGFIAWPWCGATLLCLSLRLFTRSSLSRMLLLSMSWLIANFACKSWHIFNNYGYRNMYKKSICTKNMQIYVKIWTQCA